MSMDSEKVSISNIQVNLFLVKLYKDENNSKL